MFNTLKNAFKVKDIRTKIIYMLVVLLVIRFGTHIPVPGLDIARATAENGDAANTLYNFIAGGQYGTIFAMGIGPYITASIIMQLLTVAIPKLEQINKEGEEGRKKINKWTRYMALALAVLQGAGQIYSVHSFFTYKNWFVYIVALVTMVTGTIFVMWLGELLTEAGIGNGSSFIIFANILDKLPNAIFALNTEVTGQNAMAYVKVGVLLVLFVALIVFVILVQDGERRIPVQYTRKMAGRGFVGSQTSFIPIKVNIAGVMSIIFAISLLQFPQTIQQFIPGTHPTLNSIVNILSIHKPVGCIIYMILIFCFTFFYTSFAFNSVEVADNMKKGGGLVPGVRPGKPTAEYIQGIVDRMSLIGACFYAIIAFAPILMQWIFRIQVSFGGTTLLIVSGVALELIKQLESQLVMRNYKGFLD